MNYQRNNRKIIPRMEGDGGEKACLVLSIINNNDNKKTKNTHLLAIS